MFSKFNDYLKKASIIYLATFNLNCNESFTGGLPKKLEDFAQKRQIIYTPTVIEPSVLFHTLVELVDAEDNTNEKNRSLDVPLEINVVTSISEVQKLSTETYFPNSENIFTQKLIRIKRINLSFGNTKFLS